MQKSNTLRIMNHPITMDQAYSIIFMDYPDVMSTKDAQKILGISNKTLLHLIHTEQLRSIKVGRSYRIPKLYLLQFLGIIANENIG